MTKTLHATAMERVTFSAPARDMSILQLAAKNFGMTLEDYLAQLISNKAKTLRQSAH